MNQVVNDAPSKWHLSATTLETSPRSFSRDLYLKEGELLKQMLMERFMKSLSYIPLSSGIVEITLTLGFPG